VQVVAEKVNHLLSTSFNVSNTHSDGIKALKETLLAFILSGINNQPPGRVLIANWGKLHHISKKDET